MAPEYAHAWLPKATCDESCMRANLIDEPGRFTRTFRTTSRIAMAITLLTLAPLLGIPLPGRVRWQRGYCRLMLRCLGVRISVSGGPIRDIRGSLVVAGHVSWVDVFAIGAVLPGSFVARADLIDWPGLGVIARMMRVIPIERGNLRTLPRVVGTVAARLRAGQTVVAFPEGTTWCGRAYGSFRPAMFQAAVDAQRPVQPLRLTYHHLNGELSTVPAYVGEDTLMASIRRLTATRMTVAHIRVAGLQLPGESRRDLAARCETAVRAGDQIPQVHSHHHAEHPERPEPIAA
ncbi:acyltransferase family protein [Mycobacteroides abscessus MAB_030201_1075]|uniref:Acyltransferase family protein n=1 Tax=Mycobacteroides abscessus MAB_030201_1075 TaxID=1335410 RepID=A0A829PT91_9MYCO|nr:lysophospholipid acyltransferase family protein [Mycobacteroides abscessus]ETZ74018.1 acyltransferase family protein [Mycobacteroides abscessus MAB_110811_1470]ETZ90429.1 acyltransferase family protein [Mycobacteroides abscessus MAB_030201_1075]ETZ95466.1 acyltransferase family protein [Mycobacteroides abscessus MAB_030201_1061]